MIIVLDDYRNYVYIIYIWVYYNDLTVLPHWNHGFYMRNHPQMAELFRLLKLIGGLEHFFSIYWEQSSQLTNIFQRGGSTTNQEILL